MVVMELERRVAEMGQGDHICLIYESFAEQIAALVPFLESGIARGERCVYIVDDRTADEVAGALQAGGLDVEREVSRGALQFSTKRESYLRSGEFVPEAMIEFLRESDAKALAEGFTGLRVTGEMTWALGPETGCGRLLEYEALLNRYFPGSHALAMCQYNHERFSPEIIEGVLQTHPIAVLGDSVVDNLYFEPPEGIFDGWGAAERVSWKIEQLRRASATERERRREAAEAANVAKSVFLANMSHELRTPINAIIGYTELLDMGISGNLNDVQRAELQRIRVSSEHLLTRITDILDFAGMEFEQIEIERVRVRLHDVVRPALSMIEAEATQRGIELHDEVTGHPDVTFIGDEHRTRQILTQLLGNAVKFTEPGGRIRIRYSISGEAGSDGLRGMAGPWLRLDVEDTGIGIPPEELTHIFDPFVQVDSRLTREIAGTGLGLTISRHLARRIGGDLTVQSWPGEGACFSLWLPTV